jgi:hypothetical protein
MAPDYACLAMARNTDSTGSTFYLPYRAVNPNIQVVTDLLIYLGCLCGYPVRGMAGDFVKSFLFGLLENQLDGVGTSAILRYDIH